MARGDRLPGGAVSEDLVRQIYALIRQRLSRAAIHLTNKAKENLSVPVPRLKKYQKGATRYVTSRGKGVWVVRATPGAMPRKFEGRLRGSITWEVLSDGGDMFARVGTNLRYARRHEFGTHPFLRRTLYAERTELERILNG